MAAYLVVDKVNANALLPFFRLKAISCKYLSACSGGSFFSVGEDEAVLEPGMAYVENGSWGGPKVFCVHSHTGRQPLWADLLESA